MASSFDKDYAKYYDLLYQDKNYEKEAKYIHNLIQQFAKGAKNILELGCGSGKYTSLLSQYGYNMCGIDLSSSMIEIAKKTYPHIDFSVANIENFSFARHFDCIISFFHVISYQCSNQSLLQSFFNIHKHLKPNGMFLFDCWYGPAVLHEKPSTRIKRIQSDDVSITRLAESVLYPNENIVDVNYEMIIQKNDTLIHTFKETHKMRYFFTPEIDLLAKQTGFSLKSSQEFLSGKSLDLGCWGGAYCLEKRQ